MPPLSPGIALKLARVTPPPVPADLDEFQIDRPTSVEDDVAVQTRAASNYLTALTAAQGVAMICCVIGLITDPGAWALILAALGSFGWFMRIRTPLRNLDQRLVMIGVSLTTATLVVAKLTTELSMGWLMLLIFLLSGVGAVVLVFAIRAPGRQPSPYWGRLYDILEFIALAAVFPITAQIMDLFSWVRGLGG
jgi:type VII secretion integral membrane protein EccD